MIFFNSMYTALSQQQMPFFRCNNLKRLRKGKWIFQQHNQQSHSSRQGIHKLRRELHIQPNAQARRLHALLPSNDRRDPGTLTEGAA